MLTVQNHQHLYVGEEKWSDVTSPTETRKENWKSLKKVDVEIIMEKEINVKGS